MGFYYSRPANTTHHFADGNTEREEEGDRGGGEWRGNERGGRGSEEGWGREDSVR